MKEMTKSLKGIIDILLGPALRGGYESMSTKEALETVFNVDSRDISDYVVLQDFNILGEHMHYHMGTRRYVSGLPNLKVKTGTIVTVRRDYTNDDVIEYEFDSDAPNNVYILRSNISEWANNRKYLRLLPSNRAERRSVVKRVRES